jgi:hypothetical protein
VCKRGVAEWRSQRGCGCCEKQVEGDAAIGENGSGGRCDKEVDIADEGGEEGLDCIEEDGEFEELWRGRGTIRRCG